MSKVYFILLGIGSVLVVVFYSQFLGLSLEDEEILKKYEQRKQSVSQTTPASQTYQQNVQSIPQTAPVPQTHLQNGQQCVTKEQPQEKEDSQCDDGKTDIISAAFDGKPPL